MARVASRFAASLPLAVRPIVDGEISEGDVTRHEIEPPSLACLDLFEAFDADGLPRVVSHEESQDAPRHEVFSNETTSVCSSASAREKTPIPADGSSMRWRGKPLIPSPRGDGADDAFVGVKRSEYAAFDAVPKARGIASRGALVDDFT